MNLEISILYLHETINMLYAINIYHLQKFPLEIIIIF